MMLYPKMNEMLKEIPSRYALVNVAAHRAREISKDAKVSGNSLTEKPVSMALKEVAEGKLHCIED